MTTSLNKLLQLDNIHKAFSEKKILAGIHLSLQEGEIGCLLGKSGVGKSTLFNIIAGVLSPDQGRVYLRGKDITNKPGQIAYMLQKDLLIEQKTVLDNVCLPMIIQGKKKKEAKENALAYFDLFGLKGYEKAYPSSLSGGMRQRAAFLRTYLASNDILLLDEPFSSLDAITQKELYQWYLKVSQKLGLSTIFISHNIDEALILSDRIFILAGSPANIHQELTLNKEGQEDFSLSQKFIDYKKTILSILE